MASLVAAGAAAWAVAELAVRDQAVCEGDVACLPDLGPALAALLAVPVLLIAVGPLAARLLRLRSPGLFMLPGLLVGAVACGGLGTSGSGDRLPVAGILAVVSVYLAAHVLVAVWAARRQDDEESTGVGRAGTSEASD